MSNQRIKDEFQLIYKVKEESKEEREMKIKEEVSDEEDAKMVVSRSAFTESPAFSPRKKRSRSRSSITPLQMSSESMSNGRIKDEFLALVYKAKEEIKEEREEKIKEEVSDEEDAKMVTSRSAFTESPALPPRKKRSRSKSPITPLKMSSESKSNWRIKDEFLALVYKAKEEIKEEREERIKEEVSDEEDAKTVLSRSAPLSSPTNKAAPAKSPTFPPRNERSRSRSPVTHLRMSSESTSSGVVQHCYENGMPMDAPINKKIFLLPNYLYISTEGSMDEERGRDVSERGWSGRRERSSVPGKRGRNRSMGSARWLVGHPLKEIWTTDEDVPPDMVSLVRDAVLNREKRAQGASRRLEREQDDDFFEAGDGINPNFQWSPMESFGGKEETFLPERTGSVHVHNSAYDAFRSYWNDDILSLIVTETNLHATKIDSACFQAEWHPTNIHEILCLFAFWMMLGIIRMPTITSCFALDPLIKTEIFRRIFVRKRYEHLVRAFNFVESDPADDDNHRPITGAASNLDRLHRLRPIINHLNSKFQSEYILSKDISIDESLTLWKGRLDFKQYIRTKSAPLGIKSLELCESVTGYLWSFIIYTGKQSSDDVEQSPGVLKSAAIVQKLMNPLLNKGYRLFMDNWYNSPLLARFLKHNGTDCVGTLRPSRRDVPDLITKAPLRKGEIVARHSGDVTVLAWQDKKRVTMISTCHGSSIGLPRVASRQAPRPIQFKPQVVLDYNKYMGGVDLKDQMLGPYLLERKRCNKWYMKLFKRLLNVSILNSRTLLQSCTESNHDHLAFRLHLVDTILTKHLSLCPVSRSFNVALSKSTHKQPVRSVPASHAHWPTVMGRPPDLTESSKEHNRSFRKRCVVCLREGRKSQKTIFSCETCGVPLCIKYCFKEYHTAPSSSS